MGKINSHSGAVVMGFLFLFLTSLSSNAQNYTIQFAATGLATNIDSVKVQNITQGTSLTLAGTDTLHLINTIGTAELPVHEAGIKLYPNPMQGQAEISFYAERTGIAELTIFSVSGKELIMFTHLLSQGIQRIHVSGLQQGIYFVTVCGENYSCSSKLISLNTAQSNPGIEYLGGGNLEVLHKQSLRTMSIINMAYTNGDTLLLTGYSGLYIAVVSDVPTASKTILFIFTSLPVVSTAAITSITASTAESGGDISSDGGITVLARGVCWNTSANPTTADSKTINGTGSGAFTSSLTGLAASTTYYVRAYASNGVGTAYGNELIFTTSNPPVVPAITTASISTITSSTASGGGNVTSDGGAPVTVRGVCWSTSSNPTTANNNTSDGSGTGSFTSSLTGLIPSTQYYVRAYATNNIGTAYGNEVTFTSSAPNTIPSVITTAISNLSSTGASSGGTVTSDGGAAVSIRGVCWNTSPNPTTANSKTMDGAGIGAFASVVTGLTSNTTYFIRAYATNSIGTAYGNELTFTSLATTNVAVGDTFQGGIVAYILQPGDPGYNASAQHGLIAAYFDQSTGITWHNLTNTVTGANATAIGTGSANTYTIVALQGAGNYAAKICDDLVLNSYSDWYLPSKDELNKFYLNKALIGGFANEYYWSSSENNLGTAWGQYFLNGTQNAFYSKVNTFYVRAIRSF